METPTPFAGGNCVQQLQWLRSLCGEVCSRQRDEQDVGMWGGVLQAEGRARCGDVGRCLQAEGRARCGEQGWLEASVRRSSEGTGRVAWRGLECRAEEDVVPLCVTEKARVLSWVQKTAARSLLCARVVLGNGDAAGTSQM